MKKTTKALSRDHAIAIVLAVLKDGSRHGYEIAREVERRSGSTIYFNDGTLYPVLHSLEDDGFIDSSWDTTSDRPRRIYAINPQGLAELDRQVAAWQMFSGAVNELLVAENSLSGFAFLRGFATLREVRTSRKVAKPQRNAKFFRPEHRTPNTEHLLSLWRPHVCR